MLDALARLERDYSPGFVYYKTLYHILGDRLNREDVSQELVDGDSGLA